MAHTLHCRAQLGSNQGLNLSRRAAMISFAPIMTLSSARLSASAKPITTAAPDTAIPLADLPMRRIRLPKGGVGRDYVLVQLKIDGEGPYDFMVDSGLTAEIITPELRQHLGIRGSKSKVAGMAAGGASAAGDLVQLKGAAICCGDFPAVQGRELPLPPMNAVVLDFPQAHLDPTHDPVEGMLGMEVLQLFDTDLDFQKDRVRLWRPGSVGALADKQGLIEMPAAVLNETGVLGIRATGQGAAAAPQPFVGIVDCGASFSAVNWQAARLLGLLDAKGDIKGRRGPDIMSLGVDGRPAPYPTTNVSFTFAGEAIKDPRTGGVTFESPPRDWKPWQPVMAAVGDLPVFSQLLGDGRTPFTGPAALIGLDVWGQRRVVIEAGRQTGRRRRLFVSNK